MPLQYCSMTSVTAHYSEKNCLANFSLFLVLTSREEIEFIWGSISTSYKWADRLTWATDYKRCILIWEVRIHLCAFADTLYGIMSHHMRIDTILQHSELYVSVSLLVAGSCWWDHITVWAYGVGNFRIAERDTENLWSSSFWYKHYLRKCMNCHPYIRLYLSFILGVSQHAIFWTFISSVNNTTLGYRCRCIFVFQAAAQYTLLMSRRSYLVSMGSG